MSVVERELSARCISSPTLYLIRSLENIDVERCDVMSAVHLRIDEVESLRFALRRVPGASCVLRFTLRIFRCDQDFL